MMTNRFLAFVLGACAIAFAAACGGGTERDPDAPVRLRFATDPVGMNQQLARELIAQWEAETGIPVEIVTGPTEATERLSQYMQMFGARSAEVDVLQIDVIWPGILGPGLLDLGPHLSDEDIASHFPEIIENNTVDGRLVALPWFADAGILYYRTDLLEKHGFDGPPATWDELEEMARAVQRAEREAGNSSFWGFVWQGRATESLTCNAVEWEASHHGAAMIGPDGEPTVDSEASIRAFRRAASWIGDITPRGVTAYAEEEARALFQQGNALFLRNWPYVYSLANAGDSPVAGRFDIAPLPGADAGPASALGGQLLAVNARSRHPEQAAAFARWMTQPEQQRHRAIGASYIPTHPSLFDDPEIIESIPFLPRMLPVLENAVARPSRLLGEYYNEGSTIYFRGVSSILSGQADAEDAAARMARELRALDR